MNYGRANLGFAPEVLPNHPEPKRHLSINELLSLRVPRRKGMERVGLMPDAIVWHRTE